MNPRVLMQCLTVAMIMTAIAEEALGIPICKIDTKDLKNMCQPAATGNPPPPPSNQCCSVIRRADVACLCRFRSYLPSLGIDPAKAIAVGRKCGIREAPPGCRA